MKVSRLEIKDVNQFKDLDIDLTYPKGHSKEGQPLDKVCFIGQSGTGKTTLLNFIYDLSYGGQLLREKYDIEQLIDHIHLTRKINNVIFKNSIDFNGVIQFDFPDYREKNIEFQNITGKISTLLMYFPPDMRLENIQVAENNYESNERKYDFSQGDMDRIWSIILSDIQTQQERELIINQNITNIVSENTIDTDQLQLALEELKQLAAA
jgi:GTPase SAR1 family protein